MKLSKKITIICAIALTVIGICISFAALIALDYEYSKLNTSDFKDKTYSVSSDFNSISCQNTDCDVIFLPSEDNSCKVVCTENDKVTHSVTVKDNTLTISCVDNRKWHEQINFGIYWTHQKIEIYLPYAEYETLYISGLSGNIRLPDSFSFENAKISCLSGDITFNALIKNSLSTRTASGSIKLFNTKCQNISAQSVSGHIAFSNVSVSENINVENKSGDVRLSDTFASKEMHLQSSSGDIKLLGCDTGSLWIRTASGRVYGRILTPKTFTTDTKSGAVNVPASASGGKCDIKTSSGDIEFYID